MRGSWVSPSLTTVVRKMRSPQMTGDDQPSPSMGVFHTTFSVVLQVEGRRGSSSAVASASAPRNAGQFSFSAARVAGAASAVASSAAGRVMPARRAGRRCSV